MPASNVTLYAKWTINQYTITFETNGGNVLESLMFDFGQSIVLPSDPFKEGYTFNGWFSDINLTQPNQFITMPANNFTLYTSWLWQETKLVPFDGVAGDGYGQVAVFENFIVIGSCNNREKASNAGAFYVYNTNNPNFVRKVTAYDGARDDFFGCMVSIHGDYIAASALQDDDKGSNSGSVYVYKLSDPNYVRKITAFDGRYGEYFGSEVVIYNDYLVVGSPNTNDYVGGIYLYKLSDTSFVRKITPSNGSEGGDFGNYNSISVYNNFIVVGAQQTNNINGSRAGTVYIYDIENPLYERKIVAFDGSGGSTFIPGDYFGSSVSVYGDYVVVGATFDNDGGQYAGSVYIYKLSDPNYVRKIYSYDAVIGGRFGYEVAIYGDYFIVGAPAFGNENIQGSAYLYKLSDSNFVEKLVAYDGVNRNSFGGSVAFYEDKFLISASNDINSLNIGVVYYFKLSDYI
jgi:uncharacterized repeat protein (TIGR02543 family)